MKELPILGVLVLINILLCNSNSVSGNGNLDGNVYLDVKLFNCNDLKYSKQIMHAVENIRNNYTIKSCRDVLASGIYQMKIPTFTYLVPVLCESSLFGGGWLVIQRRYNGRELFYRPWKDYRNGFGDLKSEFWYGLEKIYRLTQDARYELMIVIETFNNQKSYAIYDNFLLGPESTNYNLLKLGAYTGEAGDSLHYHWGMNFSTYDKKNNYRSKMNCAMTYWGAWWYNDCYKSNLNGKYPNNDERNMDCLECIRWRTFSQDNPLKTTLMMIRSNGKRG